MNEEKHTTTHYRIMNTFHGTAAFSSLSKDKFDAAKKSVLSGEKPKSALQRLLFDHYSDIQKKLCPNFGSLTARMCESFNTWQAIP